MEYETTYHKDMKKGGKQITLNGDNYRWEEQGDIIPESRLEVHLLARNLIRNNQCEKFPLTISVKTG